MVSIEFGRSPLLGKHTDALPVPPTSIVRSKKKKKERKGEKTISSLREDRDKKREREQFSVRNSILVKRGYKAETGVNSDRRNRYLFNARRKKGGGREGGSEKDERRLEREKLSMGLRERVFHSAQGRDKEGRIDEFEKKKKKKKKTKHDAGDAICGIGRVAGPCTRKYPRC